jgi:hypothetical protein
MISTEKHTALKSARAFAEYYKREKARLDTCLHKILNILEEQVPPAEQIEKIRERLMAFYRREN